MNRSIPRTKRIEGTLFGTIFQPGFFRSFQVISALRTGFRPELFVNGIEFSVGVGCIPICANIYFGLPDGRMAILGGA